MIFGKTYAWYRGMIKVVVSDVLTAFYQPFWFALMLSVLAMLAWRIYSGEAVPGGIGWRQAVRDWIGWFKQDRSFRRRFYLCFLSAVILFRTLLNRNMWANPLVNVLGLWSFYRADGTFTTEILENFLLLIPFIFCLFLALGRKVLHSYRLGHILLRAMTITFCTSLLLETAQLLLRVGTWQLSDLFFNTLGGMLGGFLYWLGRKIRKK